MSSVGKDSKEKCWEEVTGTLTVRGLETNLATYGNTEGGRDFLSKLKADSVFIMRSDFQRLRTKYDKPGSMFRVNRGQQEARLN